LHKRRKKALICKAKLKELSFYNQAVYTWRGEPTTFTSIAAAILFLSVANFYLIFFLPDSHTKIAHRENNFAQHNILFIVYAFFLFFPTIHRKR
jgi:hypothetical protein